MAYPNTASHTLRMTFSSRIKRSLSLDLIKTDITHDTKPRMPTRPTSSSGSTLQRTDRKRAYDNWPVVYKEPELPRLFQTTVCEYHPTRGSLQKES